jgi:hypothetical protein
MARPRADIHTAMAMPRCKRRVTLIMEYFSLGFSAAKPFDPRWPELRTTRDQLQKFARARPFPLVSFEAEFFRSPNPNALSAR